MMALRNTLLRTEAGVRLELLEKLNAQGEVMLAEYRLRSLRPGRPKLLANMVEAENAYDLEVVGSLMDPIVQDMIRRGAADFG